MKKIKTIEMVRRIRDRQYYDTGGKSPREIIAYFRRKAEKIAASTEREQSNSR